MAHGNIVVQSYNLEGNTVCFDIFMRAEGTYGFDEFRRDPEDGRGWFSIGHYGLREFSGFDEALNDAKQTVAWLNEAIPQ